MRTKFFASASLITLLLVFGCSSGSKSAPVANSQTSTVNTTISDPAACQAPTGQFAHVYVTVTDVEASTNADAKSGDSSFVDLTPGLKGGSPQQIDLLGQANNECFLASLGSTQEIQAGSYQQIRIMLAPDSAASSVPNNACGTYANCVVLNDGSMHDLALSSEAQTGLKIPFGQIANGALNVSSGKTEDLDIDFNTCSSIVEEGNGTFRLKPVLHAGEVSTTTSINGTIVSSANGKPLVGGTVVVAAEQPDAGGVYRIVMSTTADPATGGFVFCPLPAGTYDIVAVGVDGAGVAYSAGVETGIQPGDTAGHLPLVPSSTQAILTGEITSQNGAMPPAPTAVDVQVSALQQAGTSGPPITIPLLPSQNPTSGVYATAAGSACSAGTDCVAYALNVPGVWPNVGAYATAGAQFTQATAIPVTDTLDMQAVSPTAGGADCSPSEIKVTTAQSATAGVTGGPLTVMPGQTTTAAAAAFAGCQ